MGGGGAGRPTTMVMVGKGGRGWDWRQKRGQSRLFLLGKRGAAFSYLHVLQMQCMHLQGYTCTNVILSKYTPESPSRRLDLPMILYSLHAGRVSTVGGCVMVSFKRPMGLPNKVCDPLV
jgi:hypothetical protein